MGSRIEEADIDALLMGMAELQTEVEANTRAMDAATTEIARLRARVAELQEDAKMLNWLEKTVWNGDISMFHSAVADRVCITYRDDGTHSRQNHGRCLRDAIRAAIPSHLSANGQHSVERGDSKGAK